MFIDGIVLIAAVAVNCLVTTINGKDAADTVAVPYIDTLLPPLQDEQDNSSKNATVKIVATTKATSVIETTTTKAITSTTRKPITNDGYKILPEPSTAALLPPLFENKIAKEESTTKATTTTTKRPTTTTTKRVTITSKPNLKVSDLLLDPLQPPSFASDDAKDEKLSPTTTKKPTTTQKSHKQQQAKTAGSETKNKPALKDKHAAESQSIGQQVSFTSRQQNKVDTIKPEYVAKEKAAVSKFVDKQFNSRFGLHVGSTTLRPAKHGLPTITPFPHRLGR